MNREKKGSPADGVRVGELRRNDHFQSDEILDQWGSWQMDELSQASWEANSERDLWPRGI